MADGRVLISGGVDIDAKALMSAEIFDPIAGTFSPVSGGLTTGRSRHSTTLLADNSVLVVGGLGDGGTPLTAIERFVP